MSNVEWFTNEMTLIQDFLKDTRELFESAKNIDLEITALKAQIENQDGAKEYNHIIEKIDKLEQEIKQGLLKLQSIKEAYLAEELLDTIETLTIVEEGERLGDQACEVIKMINILIRKYHIHI